MKTQTQSTDALRHLADKLEDHRVAMLTADEPGHGLTSRPMSPLEMDRSGAIWIMSSRSTMQRLLGNGSAPVNLSFARHDHSDYVSVCGRADLVDDAAKKEDLWTLAARPWFSGPTDPDLTLVRVVPEHVEIWDGPDSTAIRVLAMAASVVAGREVGLGHKETIDTGAR
jgi:general stress protein 26